MKRIISLVLTLILLLGLAVGVSPEISAADGTVSQTSIDGRIQIKDDMLFVPVGQAVEYYSNQSFSGDYTIEMRASVHSQAAGLMFGSGSPNQPLWILALVNPYGLWAHMPDNWSRIDKVANSNVKKDQFVTLKIDIKGTSVITYINDEQVHSCTLTAQQTAGKLGLRFHNNESGTIDYIKVYQNGSTVFEDNFNTMDTDKWNFPAAQDNETDNSRPALTETDHLRA